MQGMRVAAEPPFRTSLCYRVHHDTEWHDHIPGLDVRTLIASPREGNLQDDQLLQQSGRQVQGCPNGKEGSGKRGKSDAGEEVCHRRNWRWFPRVWLRPPAPKMLTATTMEL